MKTRIQRSIRYENTVEPLIANTRLPRDLAMCFHLNL